jgi:transcriptional regulator with XRE-family HTH domain
MLRALRQLNQKQLARRTGVHHAQISRYERGCRLIHPRDLTRLLAGLKVSPSAWEWALQYAGWVDLLSAAEGSVCEAKPWRMAGSLTRSIELQTGALAHLVEVLSGGER